MIALICWLSGFLSLQPPSSQIIDGYTNTLSAFPGDSIELYLNARFPNTLTLNYIIYQERKFQVLQFRCFHNPFHRKNHTRMDMAIG